jgi:hypothetical protein
MDYLEKIKVFLKPYLDILNSVVIDAWNTYQTDCDTIVYRLQSLGRSIIMNNLCIDNAKKAFTDYENIDVITNGHGLIINIRSNDEDFHVTLRFKKLDKKYRTFNAKTSRNQKFTNQLPLWKSDIPKPVKLVNINIGYKIDELWTAIEVWVTCPDGAKTYAWKFRISENEEQPRVINKMPENISPIVQGKKLVEPIKTQIYEEKKTKRVINEQNY